MMYTLLAELKLRADIFISRPVLGTLYEVHNNCQLDDDYALAQIILL